jgi:N-acetylglucosaminyl-diphospho-decaprenol L-rhamnosyltransferase
MKLLIAITSYLETDLTIACLRSISEQIAQVPGTRVGVCENGTGGDAPARLRQAIDENGWESWVDLIVLYPNRGFTGGTNAAIRPALESPDPPEYVLLLNNDTILQENALTSLITFMDEHPHVGIAGSLLISPNGKFQGSPFRFPGIANELDRGLRLGIVSRLLARWSILQPKTEHSTPVGWICLASGIVRRTVFDAIGLLDEDLYTYCDDIDLCMRAKRAGWETWFVPDSRVTHIGGATTKLSTRSLRRPPYWFEARRRYFLKHHGPLYLAFADAAFITGLAISRTRRFLTRKPDNDPPYLLTDSIRHSVFLTGPRLTAVANPALKNGDRLAEAVESSGSAEKKVTKAPTGPRQEQTA